MGVEGTGAERQDEIAGTEGDAVQCRVVSVVLCISRGYVHIVHGI